MTQGENSRPALHLMWSNLAITSAILTTTLGIWGLIRFAGVAESFPLQTYFLIYESAKSFAVHAPRHCPLHMGNECSAADDEQNPAVCVAM